MSRLWGGLALLGSSATLVCCVIPALLVALGFGATLASVFAAVPQITILSEYKGVLFGAAGVVLAVTGYVLRRPEMQSCPSDPALAAACQRSKKWGSVFFKSAVAIYGASFLFVFVVPLILN